MGTNCKSCGAAIYFMKSSSSDKFVPVNKATINVEDRIAMDNGREVIFNPKAGHISHFADCPAANRFRRKNAAPKTE